MTDERLRDIAAQAQDDIDAGEGSADDHVVLELVAEVRRLQTQMVGMLKAVADGELTPPVASDLLRSKKD